MNDLISVVIPCYNYDSLLKEAIDSVLSSSYRNLEVVVVDDGSTDDTKTIVQEIINFDGRVKYFYKKNEGLSEARNYGIKNSNGDYLMFLDADDILGKRKLEFSLEWLKKESYDIVYTDVKYFEVFINDSYFSRGNRELEKTWMPCVSGFGNDIINKLINGNILELGTVLFRKEVVEKVGFFNSNWNAVSDWEYILRLSLSNFRIKYIGGRYDEILYMRDHFSMSKNKKLMISETIKVRKKYNDDILKGYLKQFKRLNKIRLANNYEALGIEYLKLKETGKSIKYLLKASIIRRNLGTLVKPYLKECFD